MKSKPSSQLNTGVEGAKNICTKRKRKTAPSPPMRTRSQRIAKLKSPPLNCGICMEPVKMRGFLEACTHVYCFSCITTWTKRSSTCPQCKREISTVLKTDVSGNNIHRVCNVKRRVLRDTIDREEFQERRTQIMRREANSQQNSMPLNAVNLNFTQQLLDVHQIIRDNMTRVTNGLPSYQEGHLNQRHIFLPPPPPPPIQAPCPFPPVSFNFCSMPSQALGFPVELSQRQGMQMTGNVPMPGSGTSPSYFDHLVQLTTAVSQVPLPSLVHPFVDPVLFQGMGHSQQTMQRNQDMVDAASVLYNIHNSSPHPHSHSPPLNQHPQYQTNYWPPYDN